MIMMSISDDSDYLHDGYMFDEYDNDDFNYDEEKEENDDGIDTAE